MVYRVKDYQFVPNVELQAFNPHFNERDPVIKSRDGGIEIPCHFVDQNKPREILDHITGSVDLVVIDELQFFKGDIVDTLQYMVRRGINVIASGLDLDFKGENYGHMRDILVVADDVTKLTARCDLPHCGELARFSQRLIQGEPSHYKEDVDLCDGTKGVEYQARCRNHHEVPGKPNLRW